MQNLLDIISFNGMVKTTGCGLEGAWRAKNGTIIGWCMENVASPLRPIRMRQVWHARLPNGRHFRGSFSSMLTYAI